MEVQLPVVPGLRTTALTPFSPYSDSPFPSSAVAARSNQSLLNTVHLPVSSSMSNAKPNLTAPSPIAPSPVNSETTEFADVDEVEDGVSGAARAETQSPQTKMSPMKSSALKVDTSKVCLVGRPTRLDEDEPPASVIYAPAGFGDFRSSITATDHGPVHTPPRGQPKLGHRTISSNSISSDITVTKDGCRDDQAGQFYHGQMPPTPLQTSLPNAPDWVKTPRAQTRQDFGSLSRPASSLASITESDDYVSDFASVDEDLDSLYDNTSPFFRTVEDETKALDQALTECWTLCNTLAGLSNVHRESFLSFAGKSTTQQQAWRSCWALCQNLYQTRKYSPSDDAFSTLKHCRDFCQALFDVRARDNETADSVLRVSFELNNHLFNMHDRNLPVAFRERTLDFYITLCHRLMKQKARLVKEQDNLLKCCWSLAEVLFSLRQSRKDAKRPDEEMLSSAVQACWELCDLFREGWSSVRPDSRQTPRPSQATFSQAFQQARQAGMILIDENGNLKLNPETPTTMIDESTTGSPCEAPAPNIVVLDSTATKLAVKSAARSTYTWPASNLAASQLATPSTSISDPQSSLGGTPSSSRPTEDQALVLLKSLFVRATLLTNRGFTPMVSARSSLGVHSPPTQLNSLPLFVRALPETAFGGQAWQMNLLDNYRRAVVNDGTFHDLGAATDTRLIVPAATDSTTSARFRKEVASAVKGMVAATSGWHWLKDLFRFAYGIYIEEVLIEENATQSGSRAGSVESGSQPRDDLSRWSTSDDSSQSRGTSRSSSRGSGGHVTSNSGEKRSSASGTLLRS